MGKKTKMRSSPREKFARWCVNCGKDEFRCQCRAPLYSCEPAKIVMEDDGARMIVPRTMIYGG